MSIDAWLRRRDSRVASAVRSAAIALMRAPFGPIPVVHHVLAGERSIRRRVWIPLFAKLYHTPLLRLAAACAGRQLVLYENGPKILGALRIELGDDVSLSGAQVWMACGDGTEKALVVGSNTYIGYGVEIFSGASVRIGRHVRIANHVLINGYDGHPLDPIARARGDGPGPDGAGDIVVDDYAWIGSKATILKNVRIGLGAVVATGAVVTKSVPALSVVAGNPARVVRTIPAPPGWEAMHAAASAAAVAQAQDSSGVAGGRVMGEL